MQPPQESWRTSGPSDEAVQATHMDAALAKICCAKLSYFEDRYTEVLVRGTRPPPRSPLIHRGYYSRVTAMRSVVLRFLERCPVGQGVQIVNLGSGFDTTYFWLRDSPDRFREDLVYFEVDFAEVLTRKLSAIQKRENLLPLLDASSKEEIVGPKLSASATKELRSPHYRFVSADLRFGGELADGLKDAGFRPDVPTLFLAECVLVYMQSVHGDSIIEWAASAVPDAPSAIAVYEQTNPNDRFGKMMVQNLMSRGCPLLSIHDYPTFDATRERYLSRGWDRCFIADMLRIYNTMLDQKDIERIHRLELLDEYEEWNLIQAHYFILVATRAPASAGGVADGKGAAKGQGGYAGAAADGRAGDDTAAAPVPTAPDGDECWVHSMAENPFEGKLRVTMKA
eukprot:TRINITY_DN72153_c0_g1_i1.p1 TRINITY_DN72153_c0_g1~~TRINITY_DN72153_c0_g1_i1.p1  ORF type:complete len:429 (-),score=91.87 TRINITY_DN72153_c0_g1_i1:44-1234(-)